MCAYPFALPFVAFKMNEDRVLVPSKYSRATAQPTTITTTPQAAQHCFSTAVIACKLYTANRNPLPQAPSYTSVYRADPHDYECGGDA